MRVVSNQHAYLQIMNNTPAKFQKDRIKLKEELDSHSTQPMRPRFRKITQITKTKHKNVTTSPKPSSDHKQNIYMN